MYILNGKDGFGDVGPFKVASVDELIQRMMYNIREWAGELAMEEYDVKLATAYHVENLIKEIKEGLTILDNNVTIICDNGGGFTVQLPGWAHYYEGNYFNFTQAADDILAYLETGTTEGWDGHEDGSMEIEPTDEQIRNGGYRVFYGIDDFLSADSCWGNVQDLQTAIRGKI